MILCGKQYFPIKVDDALSVVGVGENGQSAVNVKHEIGVVAGIVLLHNLFQLRYTFCTLLCGKLGVLSNGQ